MSRPESLLRYWLASSELPDPTPQLPVRNRAGRVVAHADLGYSRWKVALEYEGRQHADAGQFGRDVDRYSLMAADGWLVLRFAGQHLDRPSVIVERTRAALMSRGWSPTTR
jgi:very-short-patch-repair endonuclease